MTTSATPVAAAAPADQRIVLQVVQPGLLGLMDGSVSTLAPLFATAELTGSTRSALFVGLQPHWARRSAWGSQRRYRTTGRSPGAAIRGYAARSPLSARHSAGCSIRY